MPITPQFGGLIPSQAQQITSDNYLSFTDGANDFAQQYLPEIYEAEVERYGNRTLSGFLRMVGAELPMTSDQVVWSEQNRLHIAYDDCTLAVGPPNVVTLNSTATPLGPVGPINNVITPNMTVVLLPKTAGADAIKCFVGDSGAVAGSALAAGEIAVYPYDQVALAAADPNGYKVFVYGSEFPKGSQGVLENIEPSFTQFNNKPIIIRDRYVVSGSDTAQIGWVEISTEDGASGYLWYLKAEGETRLRFEDYLEMALVEGENSVAGTAFFDAANAVGGLSDFNTANAAILGTQGLFNAIETRGNVFAGFTGALADFNEILENLDSQGAIEENMLFMNRANEIAVDTMLASQNSYGMGGTSYGVFENSEEMALNLQFTGFRRGSYDFYKTSWKFLNDASTRGGSTGYTVGSDIGGVLVPAGTSTVYDQILGTNVRRPFLHVRYRASQTDDRRMKSWITGSVGGAYTSDLDAMEVHFLSERCLCVQAANNFVLLS